MSETPDRVPIKTEKAQDYKDIPATEVLVGTDAGTNISITFVTELIENEGQDYYTLDDTGRVEDIESEYNPAVIRRKHATATMDRELAFNLAALLMSNIFPEAEKENIQNVILNNFETEEKNGD